MLIINSFQKQEIKVFKENHKISFELWQKSIKKFPGGVNHNIRTLGLPLIDAYPVFIRDSQNITMQDVDSNYYTDFWLGHYSQILGHNNPIIRRKVEERLRYGWMPGTVIEEQIDLAEKITSISPNIDQVRFQTSGSESVMNAIRLARAYTGRDVVAKVDLGYHGANSVTTNGSIPRFEELLDPESISKQRIVSFHLNQTSIEQLFKQYNSSLACVIIEPVLGGGGGALPVDVELLKFLRELCDSNGTLLIFDEIVTGYRFQYGLQQDKVGIKGDLTTLGKIIGGGFPIGGLGGREDIMELANPMNKKKSITIGGGTFSNQPISLTAGLATLEELEKKKNNYGELNNLGDKLQEQLNKLFNENNKNYISTNYGSLIFVNALKSNPWNGEKIPRLEIMNNVDQTEQAFLQLFLLNREIFGYHGLGSMSFMHTKRELEKVTNVIEELCQKI